MPAPEPPSEPPGRPPEPGREAAPVPLRAAAALVLVEGIFTLLFGVAEAFSSNADRLALGITTALFFIVYGVALGACAWGMSRLRPWSRSPAVLAQLIFLGLAWNLRSGSARPLAVFGAIVAVMVLAGVLHPQSIEALNREEHHDS